jgi:hypothetical protein
MKISKSQVYALAKNISESLTIEKQKEFGKEMNAYLEKSKEWKEVQSLMKKILQNKILNDYFGYKSNIDNLKAIFYNKRTGKVCETFSTREIENDILVASIEVDTLKQLVENLNKKYGV